MIFRGDSLCFSSHSFRWAYNLDGQLVATPQFSQEDSEKMRESFDTSHVKNFDKSTMGLFPVRVETLGNMIFVNVSGDAPPLKEYLGDIPDQISEHLPVISDLNEGVSVRTKTYECKCNWKLLQENFVEYYHLPSVHPSLTQVRDAYLFLRELADLLWFYF
jgi:choline monooxygenase